MRQYKTIIQATAAWESEGALSPFASPETLCLQPLKCKKANFGQLSFSTQRSRSLLCTWNLIPQPLSGILSSVGGVSWSFRICIPIAEGGGLNDDGGALLKRVQFTAKQVFDLFPIMINSTGEVAILHFPPPAKATSHLSLEHFGEQQQHLDDVTSIREDKCRGRSGDLINVKLGGRTPFLLVRLHLGQGIHIQGRENTSPQVKSD